MSSRTVDSTLRTCCWFARVRGLSDLLTMCTGAPDTAPLATTTFAPATRARDPWHGANDTPRASIGRGSRDDRLHIWAHHSFNTADLRATVRVAPPAVTQRALPRMAVLDSHAMPVARSPQCKR